MLEAFRKAVFAGIGATVVTTEKIESVLDDLVAKGKLSSEEAKSAAERIVNEGKREFEEAKANLGNAFKDMLKSSNLVTRDEWDQLEARVRSLEGDPGTEEQSSSESGEGPVDAS